MKKHYSVLWSIFLYLCVCMLEIFLWEVPLIPHYGFSDYSIAEKGFLYMIIFLSALAIIMMLKRTEFKEFFKNAVMLFLIYYFLEEKTGLCLWIDILAGHEAEALGVNFLSQDLWAFYYVGCFIGSIIAGVISFFEQCKKPKCLNWKPQKR